MATNLGMARSTVSGHLSTLAAAGYVTIEKVSRDDGGHGPNLYRMRPGEPVSLSDQPTRDVGISDMGMSDRPNTLVELSGHTLFGTPDTEQTNRTKQTNRTNHRTRSARPDVEDSGKRFDEFWRIYPSRGHHPNPKKPAREKFEAKVKRGIDSEDIIIGARKYATYVAANISDPRHVAQAATWLNQERWNDYQEMSKSPQLRVGMN